MRGKEGILHEFLILHSNFLCTLLHLFFQILIELVDLEI